MTTPLRFSINVYGSQGHGAGHPPGHPIERYVRPEERFVSGNGPVRVLVENGKRLKVPKVVG